MKRGVCIWFCLSKIERGSTVTSFRRLRNLINLRVREAERISHGKDFAWEERATRVPTIGPNAGRMTTRNKPYSTKTFAAGRQIESEGLGIGAASPFARRRSGVRSCVSAGCGSARDASRSERWKEILRRKRDRERPPLRGRERDASSRAREEPTKERAKERDARETARSEAKEGGRPRGSSTRAWWGG